MSSLSLLLVNSAQHTLRHFKSLDDFCVFFSGSKKSVKDHQRQVFFPFVVMFSALDS